MKCTILGSGGSVSSVKRHNTSLLIRHADSALLVDCNGVCVQRLEAAGQSIESIESVFLTHEHIDHISAINNLIHQIWVKACLYAAPERRTKPLTIYANAQTIGKARRLIETVGLPGHPHIFPIEFVELDRDGGRFSAGKIEIEYFPVIHGSVPCFGMVWRDGGRGLVYSCDTEPCDNVFGRVRDGDILLHDCNKIDRDLNPEHTTWAQLEKMLPTLPAARLYLLHLPLMQAEEEAGFAAMLKSKYEDRVVLGEDGMEISI